MKRAGLLLIVTLVLLPGAAAAKGFYLSAAGGTSSADGLEIAPQLEFSFDDGAAVSVGGGYDLGWLRLDLALAHTRNDVDNLQFFSGSSPGEGEITVTSLIISACLEYEIASLVTPWLGVGVGTGVADFHNAGSQGTGVLFNESDSGAIAQLQLGAAIRFGGRWLGTIEYDFTSIPMTFTNVLAGQTHEADLNREVLLLGARYEF